jgi:hypothetical protein
VDQLVGVAGGLEGAADDEERGMKSSRTCQSTSPAVWSVRNFALTRWIPAADQHGDLPRDGGKEEGDHGEEDDQALAGVVAMKGWGEAAGSRPRRPDARAARRRGRARTTT